MNNHSHQHVIPDDPHKKIKFYMEYQKKPDVLRFLNLWTAISMPELSTFQHRPSSSHSQRLLLCDKLGLDPFLRSSLCS
jgi:hypothetical protein